MTGFGRSSNRGSAERTTAAETRARATPADIDVSVRAVNGRFLEMRFHLPREYAGLESELKTQLSKTFSRGTVDVYVNRVSTAQHATVEANAPLANQWLKAYRQLGQDLKLPSEPSLEWVARLPEILVAKESGDLTPAEATEAKELVQKAAEACDLERLREGQALQTELERHCAALETLAAEIQTLKADANRELEQRYRDRLAAGLQKWTAGTATGALQIDEQRIAQEIVIQLDRADISEEIQRLTEHIKAYRQLLKSQEPQGKKLDFYAQELLREVNTIGSKSHIARLTSLVVDAKTLVERIREQVQNCE